MKEVVCTRTSDEVVLSAAQSRRGSTLMIMSGLTSMSSCTSSASLGWSGNEPGELLQALTAQFTKLSVRTFMIECLMARQCFDSTERRCAGGFVQDLH